jgi:hypothetical protein
MNFGIRQTRIDVTPVKQQKDQAYQIRGYPQSTKA